MSVQAMLSETMFLIFVLVAMSPALGLHQSPQLVRKIIGGEVSSVDLHPWFVGLRHTYDSQFHFCGGTIVGRRWILTAAHCVEKSMAVTVGIETAKGEGNFSKSYVVEEAIVHKGFDKNLKVSDDDIALLKTKENIAFNPRVEQIYLCLNDSLPPKLNLTVRGMGRNELFYNKSTKTFRHLQNQILEMSYPAESFLFKSSVIDLLHWGMEGRKSTCSGDSGGPLFSQLAMKAYGMQHEISFQYGVVRSGVPCDKDTPIDFMTFTRVSAYCDWIAQKTRGQVKCYGV
ncbi:hypothetical protein L596_025533 [Steinernema carpocapsae]|uniref:Peptidase S1 domain-containing protein n=1 Tax=Steinernema carpocapsae TaxID=34508 RepID=A0A4U5M881_STECR|nr:hypothetical protein L596_025533 [Steinernema carpocapsae]